MQSTTAEPEFDPAHLATATTTLQRLKELDSQRSTADGELSFFGRDNEELEQQVINWVLDTGHLTWMKKLLPHIKPDLFSQGAGHLLMSMILNLEEQYGQIPSRPLLRKAIDDALVYGEDDRLYDSLTGWLTVKPDPRVYSYLNDTSEKGLIGQLKARAYKYALSPDKWLPLLETRDYDALDKLLPTCFPDPEQSETWDLKADLDAILSPDSIQSIGVGFPSLDKVMHESGAARGEVFVFLANTGVGKTTLMLNVACHALRQGRRVLYVVLEGTTKAVGQRLVSVLAGAPTRTLSEHAHMARGAVAGGLGNIKFVQPRDELWTARSVAKKVESLRTQEGWVPDVIIVDYAKFLKPTNVAKQDQEYVKLARVMDDCKRLALDTDTLLITAQQANREGEGQALIGLKHAAGSYDALQPVDYAVTINQTLGEEVAGQLRLAVSKNRHGKEQDIITCEVNRASGRVKEVL